MDTLIELFGALTRLVDSLADVVTDSPWTYLVILALAAFDAVLPILPGESAVLVAAVLAGAGRLDILTVTLAAGVGAFLGDNLAYWTGRVAGRPLVLRVLRGREDRLDWVQTQFAERGGVLIIVGRFVPGGRTAVAIGAGVLHYPWPRYLAFAAVAATLWAIQAALPGYLGGVLFADRPWLGILIGVGLAVTLGLAIGLVRRWWRARGASGSGTGVAGSAGTPAAGLDAAGIAVRPPSSGPDGHDEEDAADPDPGAHGGGDEPEFPDPQEVTHPSAQGQPDERPRARRDEDGEDVPSGAAAEEEVGAGVERPDQERQDEAGAEGRRKQAVGHRPTPTA
jgi:membrane-associated protein